MNLFLVNLIYNCINIYEIIDFEFWVHYYELEINNSQSMIV